MKLKFKGIFKNYDELPKGNLPANAVKFKEIKGFLLLNLVLDDCITAGVCAFGNCKAAYGLLRRFSSNDIMGIFSGTCLHSTSRNNSRSCNGRRRGVYLFFAEKSSCLLYSSFAHVQNTFFPYGNCAKLYFGLAAVYFRNVISNSACKRLYCGSSVF